MSCCSGHLEPATPQRRWDWDLGCLILAGFLAGNSTLVALVANLNPDSDAHVALQTGLLIVTGMVLLLLLPQLLRRVWLNLSARRWSVDLLFLLGVVGAFSFSMASYLQQTGAVYFEVVSILLVIYCVGSRIKGDTQKRVWSQLDAWAPDTHHCQRIGPDGWAHPVLVSQIEVGDRVQVSAGDMIPVDGRVEHGEAFVREASLTGEPHLRPVRQGDSVWASSVVVDAVIQVRAEADGRSRQVDRIGQRLIAAAQQPSRWETRADAIARWFTPLVATITLVTFLAWWPWVGAGQAWLIGMSVLLVACPCAFGFATPVSIWVTLSRLASRSMIVQRNDAIERLALIDTVVFDKTGTLTVIEPSLMRLELIPGSGWSREDVRLLAASVEAGSQHPIAHAFRDQDQATLPLVTFELLPARGVQAQLEFRGALRQIAIGRLGGWGPASESVPNEWVEPLVTVDSRLSWLEIRIDGACVALAAIGERPIDTLDPGLQQLEQAGLEVKLFSGDASDRVQRVPIDDARSGMTPGEKADTVLELERKHRRVLIVGDGINDAAAMVSATAAVAVDDGTPLAIEAADVIWVGQDLRSIAAALSIARRSVERLSWSLRFALTFNTVGMGIAASGWLHPVVAVVLMMGASLTVVLHAADPGGSVAIDEATPLQVDPPTPAAPDLVQLGG